MSSSFRVAAFGLLVSFVATAHVACTSDDTGAIGSADAGAESSSEGGASIAVADYDRSCTADTDCDVTYEGSACSPCLCPNAAIAKSAMAKYSSDFGALKSACSPPPGQCLADCVARSAVCQNGTCAVAK